MHTISLAEYLSFSQVKITGLDSILSRTCDVGIIDLFETVMRHRVFGMTTLTPSQNMALVTSGRFVLVLAEQSVGSL